MRVSTRSALICACIVAVAAFVPTAPASAVPDDHPRAPDAATASWADRSLGATFVNDFPDTGAPTSPSSLSWRKGMDISYWQGPASTIGWDQALARGAQFTYVKVSEGSYGSIATRYAAQRRAAQDRGLYTGPYHFANPNEQYATASEQARLFAGYSVQWDAPGNRLWAPGEHLLPPMVDLEWNPYPEDGDACCDLSPTEMVDWIHQFLETATTSFGRPPVIYTSASWWSLCTDDSDEFGDYPLALAYWTADKNGGPGALPAGWNSWTFWQHGNGSLDYTEKGELLPGDQQFFRGTTTRELEDFANVSPF